MAMRTYRQLDVWQRAIELTEAVYRLAADFPSAERFGLTSQIQRAAVSVAANIAEGYGRTARGDYLQHLSIARGSLMELETHLTLAVKLRLAARPAALPCWKLAQQVGQMLNRLIASLRLAKRDSVTGTRDPEPGTRR